MNILQVFNQYLELGGEEEWVNRLRQLSIGHYKLTDLRFHSEAWRGRGAPNIFRQATLVWNNPNSRSELRNRISEVRPDILLYHNLVPVASFGLYEEALLAGIPVVQYVHNFRPFSPTGTLWVDGRVSDSALRGNPWPEVLGRMTDRTFLRTLMLAYWQRKLLHSGRLEAIKVWITVSEFMREKFIFAGIDPDKIRMLRHCWTPRCVNFKPTSQEYYLFLGRLVPEKGPYTLLEAWRILERRLGSACPKLVIAGSGPESAQIHAAASTLKHVSCVGFVSGPTKDELLTNCKALIAPSIWWEPLGLIVYEAYDFGKPVLAAATGGLTETVVPGVTGFLHAPGDAESLVAGVEMMEMINGDVRSQMGMAGRKWLSDNASPEAWQEEFMAIMELAAVK